MTTRPDISYAVRLLSRFMHAPKESHWKETKRVLRYIRGTLDLGLEFTHSDNFHLTAYSNADWADNIDDRKSTSGYLMQIGSTAISWSSKKQMTVALSSIKVEYIATARAACEITWLR